MGVTGGDPPPPLTLYGDLVAYVPTSCILFHGPNAESVGHTGASTFGRLLPFTGSSLKKDGAREIVSLFSQRAVGGGQASVLIGPVDEINPATSDVLLKSIEDFDPAGTRPFLWAWDLGGWHTPSDLGASSSSVRVWTSAQRSTFRWPCPFSRRTARGIG